MESQGKDQGPTDGLPGDVFDFDRLFSEAKPKLRENIGRMLVDKHDVEDALQETAFRIWKYRNGLKYEEKFSAWVLRIAVNVVIDFCIRREKRNARLARFRVRVLTTAKGKAGQIDPDVDPQARYRTVEIIESIPDHCREIYVAKFLYGYANVELARMFNLHENTIRNRLRAAEKVLERKYADEDQQKEKEKEAKREPCNP